jgi:CPA1 family monovalent cation:H+ antiporter
MPDIGPVVLLIVGVVAVNGLAGRIRMPAPILLVIVGLAVSFIPGMPAIDVDPELILTVLIPPLLYAAATESSVVAIRSLLRSIFQLAVGMVLVTAFAVATVVYLLIPGIPFAAGLALGAIVAPPDAVAAVAVARRAGLPRRVVTVLEGESLFNDATSLVLLRVALVGIAVGSMSWGEAVLEFAWATVGGLLVGAVVGWVLSWGRRLSGSALATTAMSLVAPFVAYLLGERVDASGVLAVVTAGLVLGFRAPYDLAPEVRLTLRATWSTIQYVLEGTVFALIGLQLWAIVTAPDIGRRPVLLISGAVLLTVILVRPAWIFLLNGLGRMFRRPAAFADWRPLAAVSWAGMRGVVSLAAAQTLPLNTPYRPLLLTCTIVVILGTLVVQGLSLPRVISRLHFPGDPAAEIDAERMAARDAANKAIAAAVESDIVERKIPDDQARRMRLWVETRDWRRLAEKRSKSMDDTGRVLTGMADWNREMMRIERDVFVRLRNSGHLSDEVMREIEYGLDLEEALLDQRIEAMSGHLDQLRGQEDDDPDGPSRK